MASQAQQLANSANAQLSTGPRTEAGKAQSAQNARKHGLTAAELVIPFEDREEFEALHTEYETDIRPRAGLQRSIFEELVAAAWNLRRVRRLETEACSTSKSYSELLGNAEVQTKLDRLGRHKARIERTFYRALRELKALQTNDSIASGTCLPLASATQIARFAKRTQSRSPDAENNEVTVTSNTNNSRNHPEAALVSIP